MDRSGWGTQDSNPSVSFFVVFNEPSKLT
uniref:Uncharacterized protein n=1 Tax=Anguilla anguilla TaxID=7936 RepID=A0A0E9VE13_ANGAN